MLVIGVLRSVSVSLLQETDVTGLRPLQPKQQTIVGTPVGACVLPALNFGVTCALIAESTYCVIVGHIWTTNNNSAPSVRAVTSGTVNWPGCRGLTGETYLYRT